MLITLLKGILIGMIISAPLGPVGVLCLRETLSGGRREGLLTGLGAMISDVIYGLVVYIGVGMVLSLVSKYDAPLRISGGVIILLFSYILYRKAHHNIKTSPTRRLSKAHGARKVITALLVTLSNPFIMFLILPLYARFGFVRETSYPELELSVAMLGLGLGCMLWWTIMTWLVLRLAKSTGTKGIKCLSYSIAVILAIIGVLGIYTGISDLIGLNTVDIPLIHTLSSPQDL